MPGRSASLMRLARQVGPAALEGFEDEGLIRLDDSAQTARLVVGGRAQVSMPPAERGGRMDAAQFRGLRQALALDQCRGLCEPLLHLAQMRDGRSGQALYVRPQLLQRNGNSPSERPQPTISRPRNAGSPGFPLAQRSSFQARPPSAGASLSRARRPLIFRHGGASPAFASASTASPIFFAHRLASPSGNPESPEPASNHLLDPALF